MQMNAGVGNPAQQEYLQWITQKAEANQVSFFRQKEFLSQEDADTWHVNAIITAY